MRIKTDGREVTQGNVLQNTKKVFDVIRMHWRMNGFYRLQHC
jgi:hypothetical protein